MTEKRFFDHSFYKLTVGMFFLINPLFNILDILPDVIGYLLIYSGLSELSQLDGRMDSARKKVQYLIAISALKLALTPSVFMNNEDSNKLLAVFCFGLVELLLLVMFTQDFFEGFSYLADRNKGELTSVSVPNAKFLSSAFFIAKIVLTVVPELYSLIKAKEDVEISDFDYYQNLMSSKPIAQALCIFAVFVLGIFWYISVFKMLRTAKKEEEFKSSLQEHYKADYLAFPEKLNYKNLRIGLYIAFTGLIFFIDISIDGIRILTWAGSVLLIYLAALKMKNFGSFKMTFRMFPAILIIQILTEAYRYVYPFSDTVMLNDISVTTVALNSAVSILKSVSAMIYVGWFLLELRQNYYLLTGEEAPTFDLTKIMFVTIVCVKTLQISLPTTYPATNSIYIMLTVVWLILCGRNIIYMIDDYGKSVRLL